MSRTKRAIKCELSAARKLREQLWAEYQEMPLAETRERAVDAARACDRLNIELDNLSS